MKKSQKNMQQNENVSAGKINSSNNESSQAEKEIGGYADQGLPEPTRHGDWEVGGRCSDF